MIRCTCHVVVWCWGSTDDNDNDNDKFIDRPQVHNITIIKKGHFVWSKLQIPKLLKAVQQIKPINHI